jgi:hypothetical protein
MSSNEYPSVFIDPQSIALACGFREERAKLASCKPRRNEPSAVAMTPGRQIDCTDQSNQTVGDFTVRGQPRTYRVRLDVADECRALEAGRQRILLTGNQHSLARPRIAAAQEWVEQRKRLLLDEPEKSGVAEIGRFIERKILLVFPQQQ